MVGVSAAEPARRLAPLRRTAPLHTLEYGYSRTMRAALPSHLVEREVPLPGLREAGNQLAVPLAGGGTLQDELFVEGLQEMRFSWDDEDPLVALAALVAGLASSFQACVEGAADVVTVAPAEARAAAAPAAVPLRVRHYEADASVFFNDDYLIKGVAGAVLWKLLRDHEREQRVDFTNRELRLAPELRLPEVGDNLEARLVLLTQRLVDRQACMRPEKIGRGRFRLHVLRPLQLVNVSR